jgi:hypothetical protein
MTGSIFDDIAKADDTNVDGKAPPSSKVVDWLHGKASTDKPEDVHHSIGFSPTQVSQGNHNHDGKNSVALFDDADIPADLSATPTNAQIAVVVNQILALLRARSS